MEFFLEMFFTAVVALLFSFLVAKLVSMAMTMNAVEGGNHRTSDQPEKPEFSVGDGFVTEELRFGMKIDARVLESEKKFQVFDQNVEPIDLYGTEAESTAAVSPENVRAKEMVVPDKEENSEETVAEPKELIVRTTETESSVSVSPENVVTVEIMIQEQEERRESTESGGDVSVAESEEVKVEESGNTIEWKNEEESESMEETSKETEDLCIEEDDDWEGIERSELDKAFAVATKFLEESSKAEEIGVEAKMRLYGLHKIATEGSCREAQPMAVMVFARAKWNAWQVLGNMSQEEAMEEYLALISKEIPGLINTSHILGKMPEMETSAVLLPNSASLEDPTTLDTPVVASKKNGES